MKTSELIGKALDWAVAKADKRQDVLFCQRQYGKLIVRIAGNHEERDSEWLYSPSTDWAQGGLIIESECIGIGFGVGIDQDRWEAGYSTPTATGKTPLEAAMRCYVNAQLGDTVEIPKELM